MTTALKTKEQQAEELAKLLPDLNDFDRAVTEWRIKFLQKARPKQIIPLKGGSWTTAFLCSGRGFGKTFCGSNWLGFMAAYNPGAHCAVICPTQSDITQTAFEGLSGLLAMIPEEIIESYNKTSHMLTLKNSSKIIGYSAEKPDRLRGPNHSFVWFDELAAFQEKTQSGTSNRMVETFDMAMMTLRIGEQPRTIITSTPRPLPLIKQIINADKTLVIRGSTMENAANLSPSVVETMIKRYQGTRLGRQELYAEVLEDLPGALWTSEMIEEARRHTVDRGITEDGTIEYKNGFHFHRVVVGIDPSGTDQETRAMQGIVTCGLGNDGKFYVIEDASVKGSPKLWAQAAIRQYKMHSADLIVAEKNYGGDMVEAVIQAEWPNAPVKLVTATKGKQVRAEPIAMLYEQERVKHLCKSAELEQQMTLMTHEGYEGPEGSPDRLDAMVWSMTELSTAGDQAEGVILKRALWKPWPKGAKLPEFKHIVLSFHLPFDGQESFDKSACSVWGIFRRKHKDDEGIEHQLNNAMLLYAWTGEYTLAEFSDLARATYNEYHDWAGGKITCLIEDVAGSSIFARELQRSHIKLQKWAPKRGSSGTQRYEERAHAAAVTLERGAVWHREHEKARKVVNDCAKFPNGPSSEIAKSVIQALLYLRMYLGIEVSNDQLDQEETERLKIKQFEQRMDRRRRRPIYA